MPGKKKQFTDDQCHCGSGEGFAECCGLYLDGGQIPQSPERLMRSRYSAFALCNESYLLATWHPKTRPSRVRLDEKQHWLGLRIRGVEGGAPGDSDATVEFVARFKIAGKGHRLHEISRFRKIDNRWFYLDGEHLTP